VSGVNTTGKASEPEAGVYRDALEALILTATIAKDARQATEQRLKGFGATFTAPQYRLLRQLQQGRATIKELSRAMLVEPATLVNMVDTLERHGLLRRGADPHDRRRTPLELTEAGLAQLSQVPIVHENDPIAGYLRALSEAERMTFLRHLRGLVASLHGDENTVRHITDAVNAYFDSGQALQTTRKTRKERHPFHQSAQLARPEQIDQIEQTEEE
jgi:DNA-binding MarR family transcriptional regulator